MAKVELDEEEWRVILMIFEEVNMPMRITRPLQMKVAEQLKRQGCFAGSGGLSVQPVTNETRKRQ